MQNITLGQICAIILFFASFIGGIITLFTYIKKGLKSVLKDDFEGIKKEISVLKNDIGNVKDDIREIDISNCKNFLINCYAKIEVGHQLDETEKERYYEQYDLYTNKYHQNSYIHARHEKLRKEGKL